MSGRPSICTVRLLVCSTCLRPGDRQPATAALHEALLNEGIGNLVAVEFGGCMNACGEPVAIGLQGVGCASYLFSGLDPAREAEDVARTCKAYMAANKGWIVDAQACGELRHKLRARLPAWPSAQ